MKRFSILFAMIAAALLGASTPAHAETWAVNTGTQDWNTAGNWSPASVPNGIGAAAIFNDATATGNRVATLSADVTIGSLSFNNNSARTNTIGITNTDNPILTFDAADAGPATITVTGLNGGASATPDTIFAAVVLNDDVVVDVTKGNTTSAAGEFTFRSKTVTGPGGITKNGTGVMTLADTPKAYTGPTIINNGRLRLNGTALLTGTSSVTVNSGGQFDLEGSQDYIFGGNPDNLVTLNGFGLFNAPAGNFPGAIRTGSGLIAIIENKIKLASDASIDVVSTNVSTPGKLLLFNEVSGSGRLIANQKAGLISREGFIYLGHSNSYTGGTTIEQGTLILGSTGFQTGFPQSPDANLGTGSVMADGLTPAADNNPDGAASGKLSIEAGVTNAIFDTAYLNLTGGGTAGTPDRGAALLGADINETVGGLMLGGVIQPAGTYGSTSSSATFKNDEYFGGTGIITVVPAGVPGDYDNSGVVDAGDYVVWKKGGTLAHDFTPGNQAADYDFWRSRFGATTNPGSGTGLNNAAVPEPSTVALIACLVSLLSVGRRRTSVLI